MIRVIGGAGGAWLRQLLAMMEKRRRRPITLHNLLQVEGANGALVVTAIDDAVALLKRVRAHDHPALISAMEIQRKIHFDAAQ